MKRRDFIKLSLITGFAVLQPTFTYAKGLDLSQIQFSSSIYNDNNAQTIIIFMYGGASQLAGNISNIDAIKAASQSDYNSYFRGITLTENKCWQEAGGTHMETLMTNGDMTLFRCCYSKVRDETDNKAHGECTVQNQKGTFNEDAGGILANLAQILEAKNIFNENTLMPLVTLEGESKFYIEGNTPLASYLKPVGINETFNNPYQRENLRSWYNYTEEERDSAPDSYWKSDAEGGFEPALTRSMDTLAQQNNRAGKIKEAFTKRSTLSSFIDNLADTVTPDLGADAYPDNDFSKKIEAAVKLLSQNSDTKVITIGTGGLGGWDDHNEARDYVTRTENLFASLKSAIAHIKAVEKIDTINIMVFGEFGRNVNLNSANGWDHGNLQNFYVLGGKGYFNHKGVVGETILENTGQINRLYLKPKSGTYQFEPMSIAATLYKIYGIENPEILTDGYEAITPLFT
jgi:hypothetical protein